MSKTYLKADRLTQAFGKQRLFEELSFSASEGDVLLITGPNGSGKSTLLKILSGFRRPDSGQVRVTMGKDSLPPRELFHRIGMCAPDMRLYEELTGWEHMVFFSRLRGMTSSDGELRKLLQSAGIDSVRHRTVGLYSSGMKQRLKLLLSVHHEPPLLYLDEPGSNLDNEGMNVVADIIRSQKNRGIVVLASNDSREFEYGTQNVTLAC